MKENSIKQVGRHIFSFLSSFPKFTKISLFISVGENFFPLDGFSKNTYFGFSLTL